MALIVLVCGLALGGCPYQKPEPEKPAAPEKPTHPLELGQAVAFEFPSDGFWHASPVRLMNKHEIVLQPAGDAAGLSDQAIRFRVGQVPQLMRPGERVRITMPGPLWFKVDRRFVSGPSAPVAVNVKRVK